MELNEAQDFALPAAACGAAVDGAGGDGVDAAAAAAYPYLRRPTQTGVRWFRAESMSSTPTWTTAKLRNRPTRWTGSVGV